MTETPNSGIPADSLGDEISLLDLATALGEERKFIAGLTGFAAAASIVVSLLLAPLFTAKTVLMPPQQQQSAGASALASLGALGGLAGAVGGLKTPDEMYLGFMKSDRIADIIIRRFDLKDSYFKAKTMMDARIALQGIVRITSEKKSGLISIEVDHKDPAVAADMANAYVEELRNLLGTLAVTEAQQRRVFLENQLNLTKDRLAKAEVDLRELQSKSGVLSIDAQAQGAIRATVELRGQIASREVQLSTLRTYATAENSDVQRLSAELAGLRAQLNRFEKGTGEGSGDASPKGLEAARAYREVKYQEAIMDALVKQYELAKVDEAREGPLLQQVDVAMPPERKSKPKRAMIVVAATLAGLFVAVLVAFVRRAIRNGQSDPANADKWLALKKAWGRA